MARKLSNKQLAVLEVVRRHPEGINAMRIAEEISGPMVPCPECGGTGEPQEPDFARWREDNASLLDGDYRYPEPKRCGKCYGEGRRRERYMPYTTAYALAQQLVKRAAITRRQALDEWGDPTGGVVYEPCQVDADPDDPLEQAWSLPDAEPRRG